MISLTTTLKKNLFWLLFIMTGLLMMTSCKKETANTSSKPKTVTGTWKFTLSPDKSVPDTTFIKGIRGSEQEEYASEFDNIFLYEDENGDITGDHAPFRFEGKRNKDSVVLEVYNVKDGHYTPGIETKMMVKTSVIRLKIDAFSRMKGHGTYLPNPDYDGAEKESYFVEAERRNPLTATAKNFKETNNDVLNTLCKIDGSISSWLISKLSDGVFRPMGGCYLEKDGGGYYIFGHYGPGNLLPIYTQTVYYPFEWSWCKVRKYKFHISLKGDLVEVAALKWIVQHQAPGGDKFYGNLGFDGLDALNTAITDFQNKFGGFAISFGYSLRTRNLSIYINHSKGSSWDAQHHYLVTNIASALGPHVHEIYYFSGRDITDHWYLRRSEFGVCNTSLLFCYVLGTNQIEYN